MAEVNFENNNIEFDYTDLDAAWENSPIIFNKNINDFRLCYICKFHMEHNKFSGILNEGFAWAVDLINAKKPKLIAENFVAVHQGCISNRESLDSRKQLKFVKAMKWQFDEEFWEGK